MKKMILASAVIAACTGSLAHAQEAAAPEHSLTYNIGVASDYVFRGISQSRNKPALSAGMDYTHSPTGLYAGTWASTISWISDSTAAGTRANTPFEVDFYGGKRGEIGGINYDVGGIYYYFPNHKLGSAPDANTVEAYGQVGMGPVYFKVNYALTDAFFVANKAGSFYLDAGANVPVAEGLVLNLHYGYFSFKDAKDYNYNDWKVGITKDFGGLALALAATGTDANKGLWNFNNTGYLGGSKLIATVTKSF